jgi:hypothetical protein
MVELGQVGSLVRRGTHYGSLAQGWTFVSVQRVSIPSNCPTCLPLKNSCFCVQVNNKPREMYIVYKLCLYYWIDSTDPNNYDYNNC